MKERDDETHRETARKYGVRRLGEARGQVRTGLPERIGKERGHGEWATLKGAYDRTNI
jgi:hypothetical protein